MDGLFFLIPAAISLSFNLSTLMLWPLEPQDLARGEDAMAIAQLDEVKDHIKLENLLSNIFMSSI